jgi:hypothetical protein
MDKIVIYFSGLVFIIYGLMCLATDHMKLEFIRYNLIRYRKLTGTLEFLGGLGLFLGTIKTTLLIISSAGLSLLMLLGVIIRIKVKDRPIQILPAFSLMLMNIFILFRALAIL